MPGRLIAASLLTMAATAMAIAAVPASADPVNGGGKPVTPRASDIVGVGSGLAQDVFDQFSLDYNKSVKTSAPHLYSWDSSDPVTGRSGDLIEAKEGCERAPRPSGSSEGIEGSARDPLGLTAGTRNRENTFCTDFARSARGRESLDPKAGPGGVQFVPFAVNSVTFATNAVSNAPASLSSVQLAGIYRCVFTNWDQVGGKNAPIDAQLPPPGSLTRQSFLAALSGELPVTPGRCVDHIRGENAQNQPAENEGISKFLRGPDVIFPYSVGTYLASAYHSARCRDTSCTPVMGVTCKPKKGQNLFGCDTHGTMVLHMINKTRPTVPFPLSPPPHCQKSCPTLNPKFSSRFVGNLFVVVRWTSGTTEHLPSYLERLLGPKGWVCQSPAARADLRNYGFAGLPLAQAPLPDASRKMTC